MSTILKVTVMGVGEKEKVFEMPWVSTEAALQFLKEKGGVEWGLFLEKEKVRVELIEE